MKRMQGHVSVSQGETAFRNSLRGTSELHTSCPLALSDVRRDDFHRRYDGVRNADIAVLVASMLAREVATYEGLCGKDVSE